MENLRYLLVAIAALTLIMSVVSGVNPNYFAGLSAYADHEDEEEEDDGNSGSESNDNHEDGNEQDDDDKDKEKEKDDDREIQQSLGNHSKVTLEIDDNHADLEVEIEDGDLDDGHHDVVFACNSPNVDEEFADALDVEEGHGDFETELALANGTYTGCEVEVGGLSATFPSFNVMLHEDEVEDEEDDEDENEEDDKEHEEDDDSDSSTGSDDDEEDDDDNSGRGSHNEGSADDKRKERKERIVKSTSGVKIHERHRGENAASPGEYKPGWNYTLEAEGTALHEVHDENLMHEANATVNIEMSVWKSNRAIILLDIVGGTVELENQDYTVRIGYAIYSIQHDAMKVVALTTDDDGNVFRIKLRGSAIDEGDQFPMQSGSIDLIFGGITNDSNTRFEDWSLLLEGTIEAD